MNPADKRMMELLEKWLTSLELHLKYADLPDPAYFSAQPWPAHDRPTRWILELAKQKVLELKEHHETRIAMGDGKFAESLELMGFLANLVGSQHVQRFIPLAEADKKSPLPPVTERPAAKVASPTQQPKSAPGRPADGESTREMPRVSLAAAGKPEAANLEKPAVAAKPTGKASKKSPPPAATVTPATSPALQKKVLSDAVRLLSWGKEWHELADLIARIADRPPVAEVRRILRSHKAEIEMQAEGEE